MPITACGTPFALSCAARPPWPSLLDLPRKDRKSTRLNSSHANISYAVFCLKKKITQDAEQLDGALRQTGLFQEFARGELIVLCHDLVQGCLALLCQQVLERLDGSVHRFLGLLAFFLRGHVEVVVRRVEVGRAHLLTLQVYISLRVAHCKWVGLELELFHIRQRQLVAERQAHGPRFAVQPL